MQATSCFKLSSTSAEKRLYKSAIQAHLVCTIKLDSTLESDMQPTFLAERTVAPSMMIITPGRIAYNGLLGAPTLRTFGAFAIYVAMDNAFTLKTGKGSYQSLYQVIEPYETHSIVSPDKKVMQILIEAESVRRDMRLHRTEDLANKNTVQKIFDGFCDIGAEIDNCNEFDQTFFGRPLEQRPLDLRISRVTREICDNPAERHSAHRYALKSNLSVSRFIHLFREQTDTTLRRFCAWKRARGVMSYVKAEESLVETALSAGFADSTHFSHSVRHFFGLRPKDIIAGSRNLRLVCSESAQPVPCFV
jgi:AraC-like DNA-binding protein